MPDLNALLTLISELTSLLAVLHRLADLVEAHNAKAARTSLMPIATPTQC